MSLAVLMYATRHDGRMDRSIESYRRIGGVSPIVIGDGGEHSWQQRIVALHRWCADHPGQVVLCVDAFDTCCVARLPKDLSCRDVLFSAEANCWPDANVADLYPLSPTRYRFLNAGAWLASTDAYVSFVERHGLLTGVTDDQGAYTTALLAGADVRLDYGCEVFHNRYNAQGDSEISDGIYWVKSTGASPLVVHGNGGSGIECVWEAFGV